MAYYRLSPFGPHRGDVQASIVASTVWNVAAAAGHKLTPADFMPSFDGMKRVKDRMTAQEIHDMIKARFGRT